MRNELGLQTVKDVIRLQDSSVNADLDFHSLHTRDVQNELLIVL